ncbi:MAG: hemerythrin domain-containing protein [Myxococcota bacterium]|nr:hemerythrin domain-containing protein [Myxococcota bacterium]
MSHQAISEHRRLERLLAALTQAFEDGDSSEDLWSAFESVSNELDTHFEREDGLYFPAILALRPDLKSAFEGASRRHVWFREQLRLIGDHLRHDDEEGASGIFKVFYESFHSHEALEERLLSEVTELDEDAQD